MHCTEGLRLVLVLCGSANYSVFCFNFFLIRLYLYIAEVSKFALDTIGGSYMYLLFLMCFGRR